jgi:hypothetical protein
MRTQAADLQEQSGSHELMRTQAADLHEQSVSLELMRTQAADLHNHADASGRLTGAEWVTRVDADASGRLTGTARDTRVDADASGRLTQPCGRKRPTYRNTDFEQTKFEEEKRVTAGHEARKIEKQTRPNTRATKPTRQQPRLEQS